MEKKSEPAATSSTVASGFRDDGIGHFHKTLKHNAKTGLVDVAAFKSLTEAAKTGATFGKVTQAAPGGGVMPAGFVNPQAGWSNEHMGPDPRQMTMPPPPAVNSAASAVEMTELFWMALLRDTAVSSFGSDKLVEKAVKELNGLYNANRTAFLKMDLALKGGAAKVGTAAIAESETVEITPQTIFRCGLPGESLGPLISQFFLRDVGFGTQTIFQRQRPYKEGQDYLLTWADWLRAQDFGKDEEGNDYGHDNTGEKYYEKAPNDGLYYMYSMRGLARFVNKDALHQAYFNAALLLLGWNAPPARGNPYGKTIEKQIGFGTLGGPHLLTLVSEVANRALKVVWRQKWHKYLRHRPEAYAGLMEAERKKAGGPFVHNGVFETKAADLILKFGQKGKDQNYLLPMAFSAGSPAHPAYGAGHATVAGACVTILKAWFEMFDTKTEEPLTLKGKFDNIVDPITGHRSPIEIYMPGAGLTDPRDNKNVPDESKLTIEGELNKLAANVAMGRSMGGVHWRTDNTRSLRLGEKVATIILRRQSRDYHERPSWRYRNFDGNIVEIDRDGDVSVPGDPALEKLYNSPAFDPLSRHGHQEVFDDLLS